MSTLPSKNLSTSSDSPPCPIEISDYYFTPSPPALALAAHPCQRINISAVLGLVGTIMLHSLPVGLSYRASLAASPSRRPTSGGAAVVATSAQVEDLVLMALDDSKDSGPSSSLPTASYAMTLSQALIPHLELPELVLTDEDASHGLSSSGEGDADSEYETRMADRYERQIRARIERAWDRPAGDISAVGTHTDDSIFRCRVQIRQDARGNVEEVLLLECSGPEDLGHSLVVAINQSSPLPAPPTPKVFARVVTMTFESLIHAVDVPSEGDSLHNRSGDDAHTRLSAIHTPVAVVTH